MKFRDHCRTEVTANISSVFVPLQKQQNQQTAQQQTQPAPPARRASRKLVLFDPETDADILADMERRRKQRQPNDGVQQFVPSVADGDWDYFDAD
jgi:hypothetical protein